MRRVPRLGALGRLLGTRPVELRPAPSVQGQAVEVSSPAPKKTARRAGGPDVGPRAFTTLWTASQVLRVRRANLSGSPLAMTFGGPHNSAPSFIRAGVGPGDIVMPVQVKDGRLHVLAAMRVAELLRVEDYVARHPEEFSRVRTHPEFERLLPHLETPHQQATWLVRLWLMGRPKVAAACPGEATEVIVGEGVLPISLTRVAPPELVLALRWQSGRRPVRAIRHLDPDGRIERSVTMQGIYRLTPDSEAALLALA
jgi:hypothetical protein